MKKYLVFIGLMIFACQISFAQPKPKQKEKAPTQKDMDKMMEEAMKDMSPEEKAEMKKMMGGIMPTLMEKNAKGADYAEFNSNKQLLPKKNTLKINAIPKTKTLRCKHQQLRR